MKKINRYTVELFTGDALVLTPWTWHAIHNLVEKSDDELVVGVATRFRIGLHRSFRANWAQSMMGSFALFVNRLGKYWTENEFQDSLNEGRERSKKFV